MSLVSKKSQRKIPPHNLTVKKFKREQCSPAVLGNPEQFSCYSVGVIKHMKNLWNIKHPDDVITAVDPYNIWDNLRKRFANVCDTERCWMRQKFVEGKIDSDIMKYTFAPDAPKSWSSSPNTWLSSTEITSVMKHFEKNFSQFVFIGPSPIDFDTLQFGGKCVWNELCNFNLSKMLAKRKKKIGIILNTDKHTNSGEHWISMFIDMAAQPHPYVFYFDSVGDPVIHEVQVLVDRIIEQAKVLGIDMKFYQNDKEHQKGTTECGMYSLFLIIEILTGRKDYKYFLQNSVPDKSMQDFRSIYFNIHS